jgi:uncharacterized membrane protein YgdD (TMEM256/DUF423 family)
MFCYRCWLSIGALLSGLAVAAGAFAAHGLDGHFHRKYAGMTHEKRITGNGREKLVSIVPLAQKYLADFKTGAEYQMYHGLALLAVGLLTLRKPSKLLTCAGVCFIAGCFGFSGGLYLYTVTNTKWVGMLIVPLGGTLFLAGWGLLAAAVCSKGWGDDPPVVQISGDRPAESP